MLSYIKGLVHTTYCIYYGYFNHGRYDHGQTTGNEMSFYEAKYYSCRHPSEHTNDISKIQNDFMNK